MRKIIATLAAAVGLAAVVAGPASAQSPAQYTRFSESTAFNGAQQYAREGLGAGHLTKVAVDCMKVRPSADGVHAALWLCSIDTYKGLFEVDQHAVIGVARRGGSYVFRHYELVEKGGAAR